MRVGWVCWPGSGPGCDGAATAEDRQLPTAATARTPPLPSPPHTLTCTQPHLARLASPYSLAPRAHAPAASRTCSTSWKAGTPRASSDRCRRRCSSLVSAACPPAATAACSASSSGSWSSPARVSGMRLVLADAPAAAPNVVVGVFTAAAPPPPVGAAAAGGAGRRPPLPLGCPRAAPAAGRRVEGALQAGGWPQAALRFLRAGEKQQKAEASIKAVAPAPFAFCSTRQAGTRTHPMNSSSC